MQPPRRNEIVFDPGACSKPDIEEALRRASKWPERFATDAMFVGALFDQTGEPIFMDGILWAQAVVVEGEYLNGRVKVQQEDGLDFLIDQFQDTGAYNVDTHMLVEAASTDEDVAGDYRVQLAASWASVTDWAALGDLSIVAAAGVVSWIPAGKCKVNVDDTLAYLADQFKDTTTYAANTHLLCKTEVVDTAGDKQVRISGDWSSVNSYSGTGTYVLQMATGVVSWSSFSTADAGKVKVNSGDGLDYLEDQMANVVAIGSLPADYEIMNAYVTAGDAKIAIIWDYTAISGYSGGVEQALTHNTSGVLVWLDTGAC